MKVILTHIPIKCEVAMVVPPYNGKVLRVSAVSCLDAVCISGWGFLQVLFVSFLQMLWMFLEYINKVDPAIKFTVKGIKRMALFLSLIPSLSPEADNTLSITVYRKPMHTDQYQGGCIPDLHTGGTAAANIVLLVWRSCTSKIVRQKTNATTLLTTCFLWIIS